MCPLEVNAPMQREKKPLRGAAFQFSYPDPRGVRNRYSTALLRAYQAVGVIAVARPPGNWRVADSGEENTIVSWPSFPATTGRE